ncbi:MAG: 16S rRNA (guanine(966)-N(2))-methyltransferase RsmD [Pseudomonadota bacterium]
MRIVGGRFRGQSLMAPEGRATRPTADRVREAVFNIIEHTHGGCRDRQVLDLFAGSGALGLEAYSRGAHRILFVETAASARAAIRHNIESLDALGATRIFKRDATDLGPLPPGKGGPFDLVFLDPPYGESLAMRALATAVAGGWLAPEALVLVEERAGETTHAEGFRVLDERRFGDTAVSFLSRKGAA